MNNFQTILSAIFLAFFVFAVLIFSGLLKIGNSSNNGNLQGKIVVWGTLSDPDLYKVFEDATSGNQDLVVKYIKKDPSNYQQALIEAFAAGKGPDLFFITPDMIIKNKDFIYEIPYTNYPEKSFHSNFVNGSNVFLDKNGIIGLPIVVDPMVMYYNKNILSDAGIAVPPAYWDQLFNLNSSLTKTENDGTILRSMIGLGRYDNVTNSKGILSTLLLQSGNPIVTKSSDKYVPTLNENPLNSKTTPLVSIMNFLSEFSNPSKSAYSWNRALPDSINLFTAGKLAFYLGKASDLFNIQSVNPNLSFDVTQMLQTRNTNRATYADIYAVAVNKKSANATLAFNVANLLSSKDTVSNFSTTLSLPPALNSLLAQKPVDNSYMYTFYDSAIISKTWPDPNSKSTDTVFNELFNNVISNKLQVDSAVNKAQNQFNQILK